MTGPGEMPSGRQRQLAAAQPACPMCQGIHRVLDPALSEEHCADCGLVFSGSELVATAPGGDPTETSDGSGRGIGPFVAPGGSKRTLGSVLTAGRDANGRPLAWHRRYEFQHLRRVMQRQTARAVEGPLERSQARPALQAASQRLAIPPVVAQEAERIYREAKLRGLF
ncbi:MAG: hypothetical protein WCA77_00580, partial [Thermoplasmata archaeon]